MNENDVHLVGVQQVREMSILIHQLKRELGASSAHDILPRTRRYEPFPNINFSSSLSFFSVEQFDGTLESFLASTASR